MTRFANAETRPDTCAALSSTSVDPKSVGCSVLTLPVVLLHHAFHHFAVRCNRCSKIHLFGILLIRAIDLLTPST